MSKRIQGITIEIDGNTTKLNDALKDTSRVISSTNSEIKALNQALKLDPKNTELLSQKQEVLKKNIEATTDKLKTLKEAQKQMGDYNKLTDEQKENYRALSVEITKTENTLKSLTKEYKNFGSVGVQQIKQVGKEMQDVGNKMKSTGSTMTKTITAPIAGLMTLGVSYNAEMEKYQTALTTLTGSAEEANKIIEQIKKDAAKTPFDVKGLTQANQLLLSTGLSADESRETILALGNAISATGGGNDELQRMAYNLQQVKNLGKASSVDIKQFGMAGIDIYGLLADYLKVTKEEAAEMTITWEQLNGALIYASQEGGKYYDAMNVQSETFNGKISNLKENISVLTGQLAVALMPILEKLLNFINGLIEKFNTLSPETQDIISKVLLVVATIGPLIVILGTLITSIGSIITGLTTLIPLIVTAVTTLGLPVIAIAAVIAAIVLLWTKCEWFRDAVTTIFKVIWNVIKSFVEGSIERFKTIVNFVKSMVTTVKNVVTSIIDTIKAIPEKGKQFINDLKNNITSIIKNTNWLELGKNILTGILNGMLNFGNIVKDTIKKVGKKITNEIKAFFGISSPAKAMYPLGEYITEGIGVGVEKGIPTTIREVNKAMSDLNNGIQSSLNPTINPTANTNPLIIQIENFNNTRNQDVQALAEELEFYRKNSALARGGN